MKKLLLLIIVTIQFLSIEIPIAHAAINNTPDNFIKGTFSPDPVSEGDATATVSFSGLTQFYDPKTISVCVKANACIYAYGGLSAEANLERLSTSGESASAIDQASLYNYDSVAPGGGSLTVCALDNGNLKLNVPNDPNSRCAGQERFAPGKQYYVWLWFRQGTKMKIIGAAAIVPKHGTIGLNVVPLDNRVGFRPTLEDPPGSGNYIYPAMVAVVTKNGVRGPEYQNNYQVIIEGPGYKKEQCISFNGDGSQGVQFPSGAVTSSNRLLGGTYRIRVNEQVNESLPWDKCSGGFTYAEQTCTIAVTGGGCKGAIDDPNKSDVTTSEEIFKTEQTDNNKNPCFPMNNGAQDPIWYQDDLTRCTSVGTAIGRIAVQPIGFIASLFSFMLYIAGVGATLLIIYSGFRLLTSRGNKEIIQAARERLTAAIIGVIFIILSLVILQLIAVNILRIPGFAP